MRAEGLIRTRPSVPGYTHTMRPLLLLLLTLLAPRAIAAPQWSVRVSDAGTPEVFVDGTQALAAKFHFWSADWAYAWSEFEIGQRTRGVLPFTGAVRNLGLTFAGTIDDTAPGTVRVEFTCTASRDLTDLIGGGIEFSLDRDAAAPAGAGTPELLAGDAGWTWPVQGGAVRATFDAPLAELYFERADTGRVRCMFIGHDLAAGEHRFAYTLDLPEGATAQAPIAERYAPPDARTWHADTMVWNAWPIDMSYLNDKPAGGHGFLRTDRDRLVFADGTEARFWGTNLQAYSLFNGSHADIERQADRIAALGFNLVRIHHHDSRWVNPNVFGPEGQRTGLLDAAALDRIDWWITKLRERGVYIWLDLHVGREFLASETIPGADELARQGGQAKGFNYVNPRIERLMDSFALDYLTHRNRYTGATFIEDPAIAFVLITNENDLTTHFGNLMLADKGNPVHNDLFERRVRATARAMGLDPARAMRTWDPGDSKLVANEIERAFYDHSIERLRAMGVRVPIATSNFWGGMGLHGLASLTRGDVIDAHSYGEEEALAADPRTTAHWLDWIACAQVEHKPLTVTEWNVPYPVRDRFTAPLWLGATASFQGWDALMHYGYLQDPVAPPKNAQPWSTWIDPSLMALMPAAAVMYREGHVTPGETTTVFTPSRHDTYFRKSTPEHTPVLRTEPERSRFAVRLPDTPELDFDTFPTDHNARTITDPAENPLPAGASSITTDNAQITRDWHRSILTIDTPRTQAISGWIGGERFELGDSTIAPTTPAATIALTSLDGEPLVTSRRILVTAVAQGVAPGDRPPFLAEPVAATISLRTSIEDPTVTPLTPRGHRADPLPVTLDAGVLRFELTGSEPAHWAVIEPRNR
ncbi:MAG: hypothetical protein DHS20C14_02860 [Phycisphaeraceae bacterium]|nr:MAG: hypothetical protein DHS20C14_02860 [Phycisphaeraceae bacterium]